VTAPKTWEIATPQRPDLSIGPNRSLRTPSAPPDGCTHTSSLSSAPNLHHYLVTSDQLVHEIRCLPGRRCCVWDDSTSNIVPPTPLSCGPQRIHQPTNSYHYRVLIAPTQPSDHFGFPRPFSVDNQQTWHVSFIRRCSRHPFTTSHGDPPAIPLADQAIL